MDWIVTNQMNVNCEAYTKESWPPLIPGPWKKKKEKEKERHNRNQLKTSRWRFEAGGKKEYICTHEDRQTDVKKHKRGTVGNKKHYKHYSIDLHARRSMPLHGSASSPASAYLRS